MTYPTESFAGAAAPTHVASTFSASATSGTFHDLSTWTELGTGDPLGTSGDFVIVVDYGKTSEEKIRCSALNLSTGVITFAERGFDDTTPAVHSAGVASKPNCFPVLSASDVVALQDEIGVVGALASTADANATQAQINASEALSVANSAVQSVSGDGTTIIVSGTATEPTIAVGTVPYSQVSGGPSSLPPSGSAGGDLTGSYPNPSVIAGSTSQAGKLQLTDSTSSSSTTTAATPASVKSAYDLASTANSAASTAQSTANGKVASVTAGDSTITVAGTATAPTVKVTANTFDAYGAAASKVASVTAADSTVTIGGTATAPTVKVTANTFDAYGAAASKVASVTAGDSTVSIGGTATAPTVAVAQANLTISESQVTNLTTDLAGKAPTSRTISTTAPLQGGGDLSANRTLSVDAASTTGSGVVQLSTATNSTSTTLAATPSAVKSAYDLANAALPKSGGTMSGAIAMGSQRITGLTSSPGATTDAATVAMAGDAFPLTGLFNFKAWTNDPNLVVATSIPAIGTVYYSAIYIPYTVDISNISIFVSQQGASLTSSYVGLYNATTQLGVSAAITTAWQSTGTKTHALTATSAGSLTAVAPGIYWTAILVGNGSSTAPTLVRSAGLTANFTNFSLTPTLSTLTVRAATGGTGQTALPGSLGLNAVVSQSYWAALS